MVTAASTTRASAPQSVDETAMTVTAQTLQCMSSHTLSDTCIRHAAPASLSGLQAVKSALGPLPFFHDEDEAEKGRDDKGKGSTKGDIGAETPIPVQQASHRPAVLADGSYASQTAITDTVTTSSLSSAAPNIRLVSFFC